MFTRWNRIGNAVTRQRPIVTAPPPPPDGTSTTVRYTPAEKAHFGATAENLAAAGALFVIISLTYEDFAPVGSFIATELLEATERFSLMSHDPSDSNFTAFAQPLAPSFTPVAVSANVTQDEADALNALESNGAEMLGVSSAILTTINRAQGAFDAGNPTYEGLQAQHLESLDQQLSSLLSAAPNLWSNVSSVLAAAGVTAVVQASDFQAWAASFASDGLPAPASGGTSEPIDAIAPIVSRVTYTEASGRVNITLLVQGGLGFDTSSFSNLANYKVRAGKSTNSLAYAISGLTVSPTAGSSASETVTFKLVSSKKSKHASRLPKSFHLTIVSGGIRSASGTPLDGEFSGKLPSGNHQPGGNFVALVPVKFTKPKTVPKKK